MDERRRACTHVHVRLRQPLDALAHRCDETFDGKDPKAKGTHTHTHTHIFKVSCFFELCVGPVASRA